MKAKHYDVFVIGSGIAGQTVAKQCAEQGLSVAVADNREYGGTCANRGCDPKKVLLQFADLVHYSNNLKDFGIDSLPKINWEAVQTFKSQFTAKVPVSTEKELAAKGISLYHQSPQFLSEHEILVEGKSVTADTFVIATGLVPRALDIEGAELLITSDEVLNLKSLPKSITFLGSGYVGMEFAYLMATMGVEVSVMDRGDRALDQFDEFLVRELVKRMTDIGVNFIFEADVLSLKTLRTNIEINYERKGRHNSHKSQLVVNTAGRVPSLSGLQLEKANIDYNEAGGVSVDEFLRSTSNKKVYACGDVSNASVPLTPLSGLQGYIVGTNILKPESKKFQYPLVPSTVFTQPNISSIGLQEAEAKATYKNVLVYKAEVSDWFNAKKQKESGYAYKILVNQRTRKFVGVHLLSPQANEDINIFSTAMNAEMTVDEFKRLIFTYPSYANDLKSMLKDPE